MDFGENHVPRKRYTRVERDAELKHLAVAFFFPVDKTECFDPENLRLSR